MCVRLIRDRDPNRSSHGVVSRRDSCLRRSLIESERGVEPAMDSFHRSFDQAQIITVSHFTVEELDRNLDIFLCNFNL